METICKSSEELVSLQYDPYLQVLKKYYNLLIYK